jgi:hypothetical protein
MADQVRESSAQLGELGDDLETRRSRTSTKS